MMSDTVGKGWTGLTGNKFEVGHDHCTTWIKRIAVEAESARTCSSRKTSAVHYKDSVDRLRMMETVNASTAIAEQLIKSQLLKQPPKQSGILSLASFKFRISIKSN